MDLRSAIRTVQVAGAACLLASLGWGIYSSTAPIVWPEETPEPDGRNMIAVDLPQESGGAWVWVLSDGEISVRDDSRFVLRFWLSSSVPESTRFLIGGPLTKDMSCYGDSVTDLPATFDQLDPQLQSLARTFIDRMPIHGNFEVDWWEHNPYGAESGNGSDELPYHVLTINSLSPEEREFDFGNDPRTISSRIGSFQCSFAMSAVRSSEQGFDIVELPGVLVSLHMEQPPNEFTLYRTYEIDRSSEESILSAVPINYSESDVARFVSTLWRSDIAGGDEYYTAMQPISVAVEPSDAERRREQTFFWAGIGIATVATLLLALLKLAGDTVAQVALSLIRGGDVH